MPPRSYMLVHSAAQLSEEDQDVICEWTEGALEALRSDAS